MIQQSFIKRRQSRQIMVGNVPIGGDAPISVQSMTNTDTHDIDATVAQIKSLEAVGADIVRVSVPTMDAAECFGKIRKQVSVPLISDIHFDHRIALRVAELGVDCLRINPGNIGSKEKTRAVVSACKDRGIPIRIGVNAGSLGKDLLRKYKEPNAAAMVESALRNIEMLLAEDFTEFKLSMKSSDVFMAIEAYRAIAPQIEQPLHLGITEAGGLTTGSIKSSIGLGILLLEGIGDTIRISLSDDPIQEVKIGNEVLKSLNLRNRGVKIISCPSCARQAFPVIDTVKILEEKLSHIKTPITLSIIGCVVNGPGEAAMTDIGITGGGKGNNMLYLSGMQSEKVLTDDLISKVINQVEKKALEIENKK